MSENHQMTLYHRINVWRIADKCPVCGSDRGYSQANPGGLEFNCDNDEDCGFSEFVPTYMIHQSGNEVDAVRFDVLDSNNNVRQDWKYIPPPKMQKEMFDQRIKHIEERIKMLVWERRQIIKLNHPRPVESIKKIDMDLKRLKEKLLSLQQPTGSPIL